MGLHCQAAGGACQARRPPAAGTSLGGDQRRARKRAAPSSNGNSGMAVVAVLEAIDRALATGRDLPVEALDLASLQLSA